MEEESGFDSRQGQDFFFFFTASKQLYGLLQPPIHWISKALSLEIQ